VERALSARRGDFTASNFAQRLSASGDVFVAEVAAIGAQASRAFLASVQGERPASDIFMLAVSDGEPRGRIIRAAIAILDDGKPRDADESCAEAIARDLVPKTTTRKDVYTELIEYISRAKGHDRTPKITQDVDRRFRRNLPADDWPAPQRPLPRPAAAPNADELTARLASTGSGDDSAAYELALCDAFAVLGFVASHLGGVGATGRLSRRAARHRGVPRAARVQARRHRRDGARRRGSRSTVMRELRPLFGDGLRTSNGCR